jgi:hypothetical protein
MPFRHAFSPECRVARLPRPGKADPPRNIDEYHIRAVGREFHRDRPADAARCPVTTATLPLNADPRPGLTGPADLSDGGSGTGWPASVRGSVTGQRWLNVALDVEIEFPRRFRNSRHLTYRNQFFETRRTA